MNNRVLLTNILLIALFLFQGCVSSANRIKAENFAKENNFDAAVEYYNKACQDDPDNLDLKLKLNNFKQKASLQHMRKALSFIDKKYFREAIEELQISIAFYSSNHRAIELVDKVKMMKESFYYTKKGNKQIKTGNFENAKKSFQRAVELDPENEDAMLALEKYKKRLEALPEYRLDLRSNAPISLKFKQTPVINVFEILSKLSGVNFIFDKDIKSSKVTLFMTDVKFDRFLDVLLKTNALKAKSAVSILTKILKSKNIIANEKLNAVTIRGQKENVAMAARIIAANDRIPSEVILNVEIMEVSRKKEKDLGLSISETIKFGVSATGTGITATTGDAAFTNMASIKDISKITSRELFLSLPTATLKLLKKDGDTKILAKPQIRVSSSEKALILIGEKVPLRSNRKVDTSGNITYDYLYQDVGVKLVAEPTINMYGQVTLKLSIEISALGSDVGTTDEPQFAIKTRTTDTVLTINDGDSVIIGGLIEDEDRTTIQKIPMLGEFPVLGRLFSNEDSEVIKTDILMTITPVIIRSQDVPEQNITEFWSGSEKQISLQEPVEEKIIKETDFNDMPQKDYITVVSNNEFLPSDEYFSIQVYSSKDKDDAELKSKELEELNYKTWVRPAHIQGKGTFYRIFVGQYASYRQAEDTLQEMLTNEIFQKDMHIVDRAYVYEE